VFTQEDQIRLQAQAVELESAVADRTRDLAAVVGELDAFAYSVAHDLRAPLRSIRNFSSALLEEYGGQLDSTALDYLQRIGRSSEHMSRLIDDLLKLSKIGRGDIEPKKVNISQMVTEAAARLAADDPSRSVALFIEPDIMAMGDEGLLLIAIQNIIDNCWKFTRGEKNPYIRLCKTVRYGQTLICIEDNGIGFDMKFKHKLFAPFQRLHKAEDFDGTGIGLVIVSRVIARHGGDVAIESPVKGGAIVSIYLP